MRPTLVDSEPIDGPSAGEGLRALLAALGSAGFVLGAVVLEVLGGLGSNSPEPRWAEALFPIAWPQPLRVLWWLAVAGAAGGFRWKLHRLGLRQRPVGVVVSVAPFVVFAAGVALSQPWATWH